MKAFLLGCLLVIAGCSDAGASDVATVEKGCECEKYQCEVKLSVPAYFQGEMCPDTHPVQQGHQAVTVQGQNVRGVKCRKLEVVCKP